MPKMFKISAAHLDAFSQQQRRRFEDQMVSFLESEYPDETGEMEEDELRELVRDGIKKADGYHITLEREVARYIELMVAVSPSFDEELSGAKDVLSEPWLTGQEKVEGVYTILLFAPPEDEDEAPAERPVPRPLHAESVAKANERVWKEFPALKRRPLTMHEDDAVYRRRWIEVYREAEAAP